MDDASLRLWDQLTNLRDALDAHVLQQYGRTNPFAENLFDWKKKGERAGGKDVTIYDSATLIGDVAIGDHSWVGPFCLLDGSGGLTIGHHCSISTGAQILTHDTIRWAISGGRHPYERSPVQIGDCCFIGTHAVITRGVSIGSHAVVGAGAVVAKDVAPYTIVAGVPARPIGRVVIDGDRIELEYDSGSGVSGKDGKP